MPSPSLSNALAAQQWSVGASIIDRDGRIAFSDARSANAGEIAGRSVVLAAEGQLAAALAMIALDGLARRMAICPPDLSPDRRAVISARIGADMTVTEAHLDPSARPPASPSPTEWVLLTSGTSGVPKTVRHTLGTLTGAIRPNTAAPADIVWSTFYDIRRYGGLQILLRALLGGHSLVLSNAAEPIGEFLERAGANGVSHLTGTPSHWRSALMSRSIHAISPRYVRLSGEIADQAVLDALKVEFPQARIVHAYASTEAGLSFEVADGREGFPVRFVEQPQDGVAMRVVDGALCVRSGRTALGYVGHGEASLLDGEGFVDTGDIVERRGDRYYFVGRRGGIINVGGAKVHPEEVEAVINRVPGVRAAQVRSKPNPIVGAIVVADVVAVEGAAPTNPETLRTAILAACRAELAEYKVPVVLRFVADVALSPGGKIRRADG